MVFYCLRIPARLSLLLFASQTLLGGEIHGAIAFSATSSSGPTKNPEQLNIAFVTGNKMKVRGRIDYG
jgi:hypothetical protein